MNDISSFGGLLLGVLGIAIAIAPIMIFVRLGEIMAEMKRQTALQQNIAQNLVAAIEARQ
jgi:hypothetical protein